MADKTKPFVPNISNGSPQSVAILSKLNTGKSANKLPYTSYNFDKIAQSTASRLRNNESILKLLPDLNLGMQIVTACVLDPNGMIENSVSYKAPSINMHASVKSSIMDTVKTYLEQNYDLIEDLPEILKESLFTKGAYVEAIIPEASLDRMVNKVGGINELLNRESVEDYLLKDHESVLGEPTTWTMNTESIIDSYKVYDDGSKDKSNSLEKRFKEQAGKVEISITEKDLNLEIIDNPNVLFTSGMVIDQVIKRQSNKYRSNQEDNANTSQDEVDISYLNSVFRNSSSVPRSDIEFGLREDENVRESIGKPLVLKLPVESVIPVYAKGAPHKHVGYFVLLDENGNPLNLTDDLEDYDNMMACGDNITSNRDLKTSIIHRAKHGLYGNLKNVPEVENIEQLYGDIVDHMIKNRLRNSEFEDLVEIKDSADIYRVMLTRALSSKFTKLLYLPLELVQYYTFKYRPNGTGESILEEMLVLASMAGMLLYSNVKSSLNNAVPITDVKLTLDEDDPNPLVTGQKYLSEMIRTNNVAFPLGMTDPVFLHDWAIRSGYALQIESPYLPAMEVSRDVRTNHKGDDVDSDGGIYDKVIGMLIKSMGLSPELIEQGFKEDFAATVLAKNKLLAKRVIQISNKFSTMVTSHVRKYITNDPVLKERIIDTVIANKEDIKKHIKTSKSEDEEMSLNKIKDGDLGNYIYGAFRDSIEVILPKPDFDEENEKTSSFKSMCDKIDDAVDKLYDEGIFDLSFVGENAKDEADRLKAMIKSGAIHQWMVENNYLPELTDWFIKQDDNTIKVPYFDNNRNLAMSVVKEYMKYLKQTMKDTSKFNKEFTKLKEKMDMDDDDTGNDDDVSEEPDDDTSSEGSGESDELDDMDDEDLGGGEEEDEDKENTEDDDKDDNEEDLDETEPKDDKED